MLPVGSSDKQRTSRLKVYCNRCDETYLPKYKSINIDGSFYGTAFPHVFMATYYHALVMPPKIYFYEPKIFGFKLFGKRGSKYYLPAQGAIRFTEDEGNVEEMIQ